MAPRTCLRTVGLSDLAVVSASETGPGFSPDIKAAKDAWALAHEICLYSGAPNPKPSEKAVL
jgi:hypothetical protein